MKKWRVGLVKGFGLGFIWAQDCDGDAFAIVTVGPVVIEYDSTENFFLD